MASVDSTSDERTVNNTMRHQYRVLSDEEKCAMSTGKDTGLALWMIFDGMLKDETDPDKRRCYALAKTKIEEAVMWAIKGLTA